MRWKRVRRSCGHRAPITIRTGERAARLARHQRTQVVGDALRQHRHDAVGEVDRVAADQRIAIERRAGPHIEGDIGDGDADDVAALVVRIGIGSA